MLIDHYVVNCIIPPYMLRHILEHAQVEYRDRALKTLVGSMQLKTERNMMSSLMRIAPAGAKRRTIYDAHHEEVAGGTLIRGEEGQPSNDPSVNSAFDNLGIIYDYFLAVHGRNSIDDHGMRLDGVVHYGEEFNNAFWNGQLMVFGDGDNVQFQALTQSLDVAAHELAHGVTEHTAGLVYHKQPGALNESFSDVFGSLVKQWHLNESADKADWLIGADIFSPRIEGDALRSLKEPGAAYDDPSLGKDPQPAHMDNYVNLPDTFFGDWGGVHINSGIPNHAFYRAATALGGPAWEGAGLIWYHTLERLGPNSQFIHCANTTVTVSSELFGASSVQTQAVIDAWSAVGLKVGAVANRATSAQASTARGNAQDDSLESLKETLQVLSSQLQRVIDKL